MSEFDSTGKYIHRHWSFKIPLIGWYISAIAETHALHKRIDVMNDALEQALADYRTGRTASIEFRKQAANRGVEL